MDENLNKTQENTQQEFNTNTTIESPNESSRGAFIGSIIVIILLLVIAGYVFLNRQQTDTSTLQENNEQINETMGAPDAQKEELQMQGDSNEISQIEMDLEATNLEGIDAELNAIDQEIQAEGF